MHKDGVVSFREMYYHSVNVKDLMSKFVSIKTTLTNRIHLVEALKDLGCDILKTRKIQTLLRRTFDVDLAVKTPFGIVGFIESKDGVFELAGDDMILAKKGKFLDHLMQRYAYQRVVSIAKQSGFQIVKESAETNQPIRLVMRKWQ